MRGASCAPITSILARGPARHRPPAPRPRPLPPGQRPAVRPAADTRLAPRPLAEHPTRTRPRRLGLSRYRQDDLQSRLPVIALSVRGGRSERHSGELVDSDAAGSAALAVDDPPPAGRPHPGPETLFASAFDLADSAGVMHCRLSSRPADPAGPAARTTKSSPPASPHQLPPCVAPVLLQAPRPPSTHACQRPTPRARPFARSILARRPLARPSGHPETLTRWRKTCFGLIP